MDTTLDKEIKRKEKLRKKQEVHKRPLFVLLLNPFKLRSEINKFEIEEFNMLSYLKYIFFSILGMIVFCLVFKLRLECSLVLLVLMILFLPSIYYINARNIYEHKKFMEVSSYVEQLLYSFKRKPKILVALQDTAILFQDDDHSRLYRKIQEAIEYIEGGVAIENIYKEAFAIIEEEFGCKRMYKVHEFLIRVENAGGVADEAIEILVNDRNLWVSRIEELIMEKTKVRINVSIALGLGLVIIAMSTYMLPIEFGIVESWPSQIAKTSAFVLDMIIFYIVQCALGKSLLDVDQNTPFEELERSYNIAMHNDEQKNKTAFYMLGIVCGIAFLVISIFAMGVPFSHCYNDIANSHVNYGIIDVLFSKDFLPTYKGMLAGKTKEITMAVMIGAVGLLMATQPKRQYKICKKRIKREVEKTFPDWLLSLALQMQTDNVHVSIAKTAIDAPRILMEELDKFQDGIEENPNALKPYSDFFKTLNIPDILTAMKMIYSMSEFGAKDSQDQIRNLVTRNTETMDKAERMRMEDSLAGISFAMLLPMITGVIPMLTDLVLVMEHVLRVV